MGNIRKVLSFAMAENRPVVIIYSGKDGISQRRIYIRKIDENGVTAYCTLKKGVRKFKIENILSAVIGEWYDQGRYGKRIQSVRKKAGNSAQPNEW